MATTFTNQATLTFDGTTVLSNIAVGTIESALTITKEAVEDSYTEGSAITYVVSIINDTQREIRGLTVNDNLGKFEIGCRHVQPLDYVEGSVLYYVDGVLQNDPETDTRDGLKFKDIRVTAHGNTMLIYQATVNAFAPLDEGAQITNTVTVGRRCGCEASDSETVPVADAASVNITKTISPAVVEEDGEVTYTFSIENTGNTALTAKSGAVITDTFDPRLRDLKAFFNGEQLRKGEEYRYNKATGLFETVEGVVTVAAATFTRDDETAEVTVTPAVSTLVVTGIIETRCHDDKP